MVELLLELRAAGETDFDRAWRRAQAIGRERGFPRPRDYLVPDPDLVPFSSFFRRACEREWHGLVTTDYAGLRDAPELAEGGWAHVLNAGALGGREVVLLG